ncbi:MAG: potassium channel protein [Pirellulaceae bacterium]|nr:potassium channel protein [Pirellulaceae bacterium]
MFWLSVAFLVCVACLVVLWFDVPNLQENVSKAIDRSPSKIVDSLATTTAPTRLEKLVIGLMWVIWPIILIESMMHWLTRPWDRAHRKYHAFGLLICLCPPLRMGARIPEMGGRLWFPGLGWRRGDKRLRRRLERKFSVPMIVIALMIMPILIVEFFLKDQVGQYTWLRLALHFGTGVIWFAFATEFILMVSVADKKLAYCKKHWVDLAIILLPLFSFLRSMRALRATRLAHVMRIPQVSKLARVYRLRGTSLKAVQALILLDVFQRWTHRNPEKAITRLRRQLLDLETEARRLRRRISRLERKAQERKAQKQTAQKRNAQEQENIDGTDPALASESIGESSDGSAIPNDHSQCDHSIDDGSRDSIKSIAR